MLLRRRAAAAAIVVAAAMPAGAQGLHQDTLAAVYPAAVIRAEQIFLTPAQRRLALTKADADIPAAVVARYVATQEGIPVGRAYVDTHGVRAGTETLLVSLDDRGRVLRVDVTAFDGAAEYRPPDAWLQQYRARTLTDDLTLDRAIRPMEGAPLTARAVNDAVRRVLAIDDVLRQAGR